MPITVEGSIDFNGITDEIRRNAGEALSTQLQLEATAIIKRTLSGIDADGQPFVDYTPPYKRFKIEEAKRDGTVNLLLSGDMLANIISAVEVTPTGYEGKIFFPSVKEAGKALGNMTKRKFFALSDEQIGRITNAVRQALGVKK